MWTHKIRIGKCICVFSILLLVFENSLCGETCIRSEVSFSLYILLYLLRVLDSLWYVRKWEFALRSLEYNNCYSESINTNVRDCIVRCKYNR